MGFMSLVVMRRGFFPLPVHYCVAREMSRMCQQLWYLYFCILQGYALFGNCLCLFLTTVGYHHSHSFFYFLWLVFGGLSALKLVSDVLCCTVLIELLWAQVRFSSMPESAQTSQADLCDVKRCSCVVFSLKAERKDLTNRQESLGLTANCTRIL